MPSVTLPAAPLTGGVSTQPPANRFSTQTKTSDNTLLYVNRGTEKRFGSSYVASLDYTGESFGAQSHWVRRDEGTVYTVLVNKEAESANVVQVFGADGTKKTVTVSAEAITYLQSGSTSTINSIRMETVGDTTFIVNRDVVTALTGNAPGYTIDSVVQTLAVPAASVGLIHNLTSSEIGYPVGIYESINDSDTGPWWERQTSDAANSELDASTMPMLLVYDPATDTLDLDVATWNPRLSGDATLNPGPSFIGKTINSVTLFQDRLWISAGQQVVGSQSGDLFNFWIDDWTTVVDSDPIDITLSGSSVNSAEFMIPFDKTLLILADGARQWELQALNAFTPGDTNLVDTTNYSVSSESVPVKIANQLYFLSDQGKFSYLWEYFPNFDRGANIGENITQHAEGYLPESVRRLSASENNNIIFCWSEDEPSNLYLYMTAWQVTNKTQSSWCRWVLDPDVEIVSHQAIDNTLYLVLKDVDATLWVETIPITTPDDTTDGSITEGVDITTEGDEVITTEASLDIVLESSEPTGIGYHALMDRKVILTGSYDTVTKLTTFTLPFSDASMDTVILGDQWGSRVGQVLTSTTTSATTLTVTGDFSTYPVIVGKSYAMSVELSPPFVKNEQNMPVQGTLQLRTLDILFEDTVTFDVTITPRGREPKIRRFLSNRYGSAVFGQPHIQEYGKFSVKVKGDSNDTAIVISNSTPFPSTLTNLEFVGSFIPRRTNPTKR
tara:strand:+ start:3550 stop:5727 length:2178 start_codon:yes stop_codon:yes gene_type:complete